MNLALAEGMLEAIGGPGVVPRLGPDPTRCCVGFASSARAWNGQLPSVIDDSPLPR
jgi:hypothetical protein